MKILLYINAMNGGGAQRVMANLANALIRDGYQVYLAYDMNQPSLFELDSGITQINSRSGCIPNIWYKKTHFYRRPRYLYNLRKIAKDVRPDIVISFMTELSADVLIMLRGLDIPIVVSEHTNISRDRGKKVSFIHKYLYPMADAITLLTRYDYNYWEKSFSNVYYLPNPSDPVGAPNTILKEKVVLSAGRVRDWKTKGFDNLIKAWSKISKLYPEWSLQIAGDGRHEDFEYLKSLAKQENALNVQFLGFRNDLDLLMKSSEIFCLASRHEGLPMVLIEAMNANCCCVAFDCKTGPSEIIQHNYSGIIVDDQNVEALSQALSRVIEDDALRMSLSQRSQESVMQYSTQRIVNQWKLLFNSILK